MRRNFVIFVSAPGTYEINYIAVTLDLSPSSDKNIKQPILSFCLCQVLLDKRLRMKCPSIPCLSIRCLAK